jgi:hypothetical protein
MIYTCSPVLKSKNLQMDKVGKEGGGEGEIKRSFEITPTSREGEPRYGKKPHLRRTPLSLSGNDTTYPKAAVNDSVLQTRKKQIKMHRYCDGQGRSKSYGIYLTLPTLSCSSV